MRVAVSSTGENLDAPIDPRFGRCACFIILDTENMGFKTHSNESNALGSGAGIDAASFVVGQGVEAVLTGNCGPKAMAVFSSAGVRVYTGQSGTVGDAVARLRSGGLASTVQPSVPEKAGMAGSAGPVGGFGGGMGRCRGGSGRGMGMGMRKAVLGGGSVGGRWGPGVSSVSSAKTLPPATGGESASELRKHLEELQRQMEALEKQIEALNGGRSDAGKEPFKDRE
jgi:predicted Fe-Mo cluster-binding NifX family protein